jgi:hypothetical protein
MSRPLMRYGSVTGLAGNDARIRIGGKGRKNILSINASYQRSTAAAPGTSFQGRLVIVEGQIDALTVVNNATVPADYLTVTNFELLGKVLFDVTFADVGPHAFFLPIAQQEGSPQTDEDSTVNIILCVGIDSTWVAPWPNPPSPPLGAALYIPTLVVSGQTVFGGQLAGQQTFAGSRS